MVSAHELKVALKQRGLRMTPQRQLILDAVASGLPHHSKRVLPFPYVSVAQNRNLHGLFQFCDRIPICVAIVELCGRAGMQAYRSTSFFFSNTACS